MIDAHRHIWRRQDLPWLDGPMQPRIFGPYAAIRRDYPVSALRAAAEGAGVTRAVYVQANWPADQFADEAAWVQAVHEAHGWPHAIIAYADMTAADVRPALKRLAAGLAAACPGVTFVLQHAGRLEAPEAVPQWREGMKRLADQPNVVVKLSGPGTFIHACDPAHIAWITAETLALFGPGRCLWGSNFPIGSLWTDYATLLAAHRAAAPAEAQADIFDNTARRRYRLD